MLFLSSHCDILFVYRQNKTTLVNDQEKEEKEKEFVVFSLQDTKVVSVKFPLIHVKIIHVKIRELVFEQRLIRVFVAFVQQIIPVEHVKYTSKIFVHHHRVRAMVLVKIFPKVIDVFVHRMKSVIERKCPISSVQFQRMQLINVFMEHVIKANVLVFLVGQEISVRKISMNV